MSKRKAFRLSSQILDEASTWFVEFSEGQLERAAREEFIHWLRASPEHVRAYLQISARWEEAGSLRRPAGQSVDELVALARAVDNVVPLEAQPLESVPSPPQGSARTAAPVAARARNSMGARLAIAASILLALGSIVWLQFRHATYSTDIGEQRSVKLDDGSTVELNSRSRIRVVFREHERDVDLLEGQALFRVAKDHARPFIVHSGNTFVRAVGTQFDVYRKRSGTVVTVVEGRVAVLATPAEAGAVTALLPSVERMSAGEAETRNARTPNTPNPARPLIYLGAGEQLTVTQADVKKPAKPDVAAATAWTQKQIVFQSTPLTEVVEEFNRYNTRRLVITDARIEGIRISGVFSSTDPASLLRGLRSLGAFTIHEGADRIEISPQ